MTPLEVTVTMGESGSVMVLSGEADLSTLSQLNGALDEQIWAGVQFLAVDLSQLRFADSAAVAALALAGRTLRDQGGEMELRRPQPAVARILSLTGVDQVLTIRTETESRPF